MSRRDVRAALAKKRITVDGVLACDINHVVGPFSHVALDDRTLQNKMPVYIMMNKPKGVVSATCDEKNKTVFDVLAAQSTSLSKNGIDSTFSSLVMDDLHIVGRLDFNSSGLLLITNDGGWSRRLSLPEKRIKKRYHVQMEKPLTEEYVTAFAKGMYFAYEDIVTRPAELKIINSREAEVILEEGKYHQIKRMFGRFQNTVLALHRVSVGDIMLDDSLAPGESRCLTQTEIHCL
ncbi:MAG: pseudouridine synthase [Agarilytica sp.]